MYLFPIIGALIGLLVGLFAWALLYILSSLIVGMLSLGLLLLITGLHHTDGLLDFGDAVAYLGSPEKKIEMMHDQLTGPAGLALGLVTLGTTAFSIAALGMAIVIQGLIVCESSAKLAMVLCAGIGRSASPGLGRWFIRVMHRRFRTLRLGVALTLSFIISILLMSISGLVAIVVAIATALLIVWVSNRNFRGVTGDVMGATNELARIASLIAILVMVKWV
jgi:adenosylcobinamide-GDP ribazoletransferase